MQPRIARQNESGPGPGQLSSVLPAPSPNPRRSALQCEDFDHSTASSIPPRYRMITQPAVSNDGSWLPHPTIPRRRLLPFDNDNDVPRGRHFGTESQIINQSAFGQRRVTLILDSTKNVRSFFFYPMEGDFVDKHEIPDSNIDDGAPKRPKRLRATPAAKPTPVVVVNKPAVETKKTRSKGKAKAAT